MNIEPTNTLPDVKTSLPVDFDMAIKAASIITLMKKYVKFLFKKGHITSCEEAKQKVGEILSPALDRGIVSRAVLEEVIAWITKECRDNEMHYMNCCKKKMVCKTLCESISAVSFQSVPELVQKAINLKKELDAVSEELFNQYGENVRCSMDEFMNEFGNLFDPEFLKCFQMH